jgi:uncharacterized protein
VPEFDSFPPGTPSWVDLASRNHEATKAFYCPLFGWEIEEPEPSAHDYLLITKNGKRVGGLSSSVFEPAPLTWTTYVTVADIEQTTEVVKRSGGRSVVEPTDIPGSGRVAVFADLSDAYVGAWQPGRRHGAEIANEAGALCWSELQTHDLDAAMTFYQQVFGWTPETSRLSGMSYTEWKLGNSSVAGMMGLPADVPPNTPSFWLSYFGVDDTDESVQHATKLGGSVFAEPMDIPAGRFAVLGDPTGVVFAVIKRFI